MNTEVKTLKPPFQLLATYTESYLARKELQEVGGDIFDSYLAFNVGDDFYLVDMAQVLEVSVDIGNITMLPFSPSWLLGLASHRSDVYSVVDFKRFLDKKQHGSDKKAVNNYILLQGVAQGYILKVDSVYGIRSCEVGLLQSQYGWIDGHAHMEEKDWLRINLNNLVADTSFIQSVQ